MQEAAGQSMEISKAPRAQAGKAFNYFLSVEGWRPQVCSRQTKHVSLSKHQSLQSASVLRLAFLHSLAPALNGNTKASFQAIIFNFQIDLAGALSSQENSHYLHLLAARCQGRWVTFIPCIT